MLSEFSSYRKWGPSASLLGTDTAQICLNVFALFTLGWRVFRNKIRESTALTLQGSQVQSLSRPPSKSRRSDLDRHPGRLARAGRFRSLPREAGHWPGFRAQRARPGVDRNGPQSIRSLRFWIGCISRPVRRAALAFAARLADTAAFAVVGYASLSHSLGAVVLQPASIETAMAAKRTFLETVNMRRSP